MRTTDRSRFHSVLADASIAAAIAGVVFLVWSAVANFLPNWKDALAGNVVGVFGSLVAVGSMLVRQYCVSETIRFLVGEGQVADRLEDLARTADAPQRAVLEEQATRFRLHQRYIRDELFVFSYMPILFAASVGVAVVTKDQIELRLGAIFVILWGASYLARAAHTSLRIAEQLSRIERMAKDGSTAQKTSDCESK